LNAATPNLTVTAWTVDLADAVESPQAFSLAVSQRVLTSWDAGADVVLLPEFLWLGLERFTENLAQISALFWGTLWPELLRTLARPGKCVVLGTAPFLEGDGLRNRAVIISDGVALFQDKICLTPWEKDFCAGTCILPWELMGWRCAVLVCLDVEMPEHSVTLRQAGVDLLLVPSATESILGTERISRCASARAVELGGYVVVSHLVGQWDSVLVDENVGRLACYTPSQAPFRQLCRVDEGPLLEHGWHSRTWELSSKALREMRRNVAETNPALIKPPGPRAL
jgi:predicted amidohydrolase